MPQASRTDKYQRMHDLLHEKQWRRYLALEAQECGSVMVVASEAHVSHHTIRRALRELEAGAHYSPGERQRQPGGGRKPAAEKDERLQADLESLLEPKGDPLSLLKWTTKRVTQLKAALEQRGHAVAETTIRRMFHAWGYSLRANQKTSEGTSHPDRDAQFAHIKEACQAFEQQGNPIISVDGKKKAVLGQFKNNGAEWQANGDQTEVTVYDFLSLADGKAIPYGVYALVHKQGLVTVGIAHETAEFAVESISRWWQQSGKALYPGKKALLITADGGGSNGVSNRLWKMQLQDLATEEPLAISVVHYPPATSQWNRSEHRLFAFISIKWRAKPLVSLEVVLELISQTTTDAGLTVTAMKDSHSYPTGRKVTDEELAALHLLKDTFHGEGNYTILPQTAPPSGQLI